MCLNFVIIILVKTIYLVRHCEYDNPRNILAGRLPMPLSKDGEENAKQLGKYFEDKNITKIFSSEVLRCKQTSKFISGNNIPITYDLRLLETFSAYQGYWEGENGELDWTHFFKHTDELGGENYSDIQKRMLDLWDEVKKLEENIILCSHGDPIYTLSLALANQILKKPKTSPIDYPEKGSVTAVTFNGNSEYTILEPKII